MTPEVGPGWESRSSRLHALREGERYTPATEALDSSRAVYGERLVARRAGWWRRWDPYRSKPAAALLRGYSGPLPQAGETWLYLGAATGTTASHVADLVGRDGVVYAVETSLRPFARLLRLAERYPNLLPVLGDARTPESYAGLVPPVDGVYSDVAQPDQVAIARANSKVFLRDGGPLLIALKLSSMRRNVPPEALEERAKIELRPLRSVSPTVGLEPFHRQHRFLAFRQSPAPNRSFGPSKTRRRDPAGRRR